MNEIIAKIKQLIAQYKPWSILVLIVGGFFLLQKLIPKPRRRRRKVKPVVSVRRGRSKTKTVTRSKPGAKKAWQVKGSLAARRRMAQLRRMRRK